MVHRIIYGGVTRMCGATLDGTVDPWLSELPSTDFWGAGKLSHGTMHFCLNRIEMALSSYPSFVTLAFPFSFVIGDRAETGLH